ncbi:DJ-1/PfpI family protein [Tenacibaculum sp. SG-28]|uniref:DJ-1/PfpI family protein n=1 Tax=Tenacibaculum sp. SG-28 TaxID=754426 RepID=UPI000CF568FC|nr:DJ-1/PfpI family protein [Tenacibaculum sp. SG-28]PQJ21133.1 AraC family transcriptional regulator [Tenacibaculum sp. SG-28]
MNKKRTVGILIFKDAEVLDFAGPFEVFSVTSELNNFEPFEVFTVSESLDPVAAINGFSVNPTHDFYTCPDLDILIIAGGFGARQIKHNQKVLDWVTKVHQQTEFTLSICSGSLILGSLGLLKSKPYCTHHQVYPLMEEIVPLGLPQKEKRFVNAGKIYTSGGISAGIDLAFHIVEKLLGKEIAKNTAEYMEYHRNSYALEDGNKEF